MESVSIVTIAYNPGEGLKERWRQFNSNRQGLILNV